MNRWWPVLLPELRRFPAAEQDHVLRTARDSALDLVELLGMAAALVLVTALTRHGPAAPDLAGRAIGALLDAALAAPLLVLFLGPFHLRRLRRGIHEQLREQGRA